MPNPGHRRGRQRPSGINFVGRDANRSGQFWWAGDSGQVSWFIWEYLGRFFPAELLDDPRRCATVLFEASRHWDIAIHVNKGLANAHPEAVARSAETSMTPKALDAAGLFLVGSGKEGFPGAAGHEPDYAQARTACKKMRTAYEVFRGATPSAGSYVNESSYFDEDWAQQYWGEHYPRLLAIKRRVDPTGLFYGRNLVGSEEWTADGMTAW